MANTTGVILLETVPLLSDDAAALTADILPKPFWEPAFILRTPLDVGGGSVPPLAADADIWTVLLASETNMDAFVFYPLALTAQFRSTTPFPVFWELEASYAINPPYRDTVIDGSVWHPVQLSSPRQVWDGTNELTVQSAAPVMAGYPPNPVVSTGGASTTLNSIGGFSFVVQTWNTTIQAAMGLHIDARWLAFPRSVERSAGYWTPSRYFKGA